MKPLDVTGGESVYCINETQHKKALELANQDPVSSPRIQACLASAESQLSRNELAALAFVIIDRLLGPDSTT